MAEYFGYTQFFSRNVRYQSKADTSEHIIFYGARDLKEITLSPLLPSNTTLLCSGFVSFFFSLPSLFFSHLHK